MYFREMEKPYKPKLDKRIFWDVKFEELDYEKYANFIMNVFLSGAMWRISVKPEGFMGMRR